MAVVAEMTDTAVSNKMHEVNLSPARGGSEGDIITSYYKLFASSC